MRESIDSLIFSNSPETKKQNSRATIKRIAGTVLQFKNESTDSFKYMSLTNSFLEKVDRPFYFTPKLYSNIK